METTINESHSGAVCCVEHIQNTKYIVSGGVHSDPTIKIWNYET